MQISGFKGRSFSLNEKVRVYRNLNNGMWSIQAVEGQYKGKVVGHVPHLKLVDVEFKVSKVGRSRILREKRKNVCAFAIGCLRSLDKPAPLLDVNNEITFNPYRSDFFCFVSAMDAPINHVEALTLSDGKAYIV